jgi:ribokinase
MKPKILVVGSSNTDMILNVPRIPRPGETILGGAFLVASGGKGANQAVAAARAGGEVNFITCVGDDLFGQRALDAFAQDGIQTGHIARAQGPSGVALILVSASGENSIAVAPGANAALSPDDIRLSGAAFDGSAVAVVQLEISLPAILETARMAAKRDIPLILNPAPAQALPDELLAATAILTPNETEASALVGFSVQDEESAAKAAAILKKKGVGTVIITLGAQGAFVSSKDVNRRVPGFAADVVDTTGAGDVFNGALAVALGEGRPLLDSVQFANAAAAISVTRQGAQPSAPRRKEIDRVQSSSRPSTLGLTL